MNSIKQGEEEFSTAQLQDSKGYSSRFMRSRGKQKNNALDILPHRRQKAAITIQKFWRMRMFLRRIFYEQLLEEVGYENKMLKVYLSKQKQYLKGIQNENHLLKAIMDSNVKENMFIREKNVKDIAKECVGITFKFQKKMIGKKQLQIFVNETDKVKQRVMMLKKYKQELREDLLNESQKEEQMLLHQIREGNAQLLKIVNQKNTLKHQLCMNQLQQSANFYQ